MSEKALPSVDDDFVDVFDRLALKGMSIRPTLPPAYRVPDDVLLVQLADEFGLTTAAALDICDQLAIPAEDAGSTISHADATRFRAQAALPPADAEEAVELSLRARLNGLSYESRVARRP